MSSQSSQVSDSVHCPWCYKECHSKGGGLKNHIFRSFPCQAKLQAASKAKEERRGQRAQNPPNQCPSDQSPLNDNDNASMGGGLDDNHHDGTPDTTHGDQGI